MNRCELRMMGEKSDSGLWVRNEDSKYFMFYSPFTKTWKPSVESFGWVMMHTKHKCFINNPRLKGICNE